MATQQPNNPKTIPPAARGTPPLGKTTPRDVEVSHEARYMMIQEAAYWRAERRGFEPGFELEDWLAAENEIDALLDATTHGTESQ